MSSVVWLHDDALRHWYGDSPAVYIFDEEKLAAEHWSLKRLGFIYECLLDLPVEIRRGDPVVQLLAFQFEQGAETIVAMNTPDPRLRRQMDEMRLKTKFELREQEEFAELTGRIDLRRFSKYWSKAERFFSTLDKQR